MHHKSSCRINEELCLVVNHISRNDLIENIFLNILMDLFLCHLRIMLCGKHDCIQALRHMIFIILHRHLCLSIGTQIRKSAVLPYLCQAA